MSKAKAKELAREIQTELELGDLNVGPRSKQLMYNLVDAVLSEPEPVLRGWIEVGEKPYRQLVSTTHDKVITEGVVPFDYVNKGDPCIRIHKLGEGIDSGLKSLELYDSIKQKIKEAS